MATPECTSRSLLRMLIVELSRKANDTEADMATTIRAARQSLDLIEVTAQHEQTLAKDPEVLAAQMPRM